MDMKLNVLKRLLLAFICLLSSVLIFAQTQYDYYDDDAVTGGADIVLNAFLIIIIAVIAFLVFIFIFAGVSKIKYELSPQREIDRKKKAKEEQEKQERIRKEEERQKALLALPENTIRLLVEGTPHLVELARTCHRIESESLALCLCSVNKIIWEDWDIKKQVGFVDKSIDWIYGKYYKSRLEKRSHLTELIVSRQCADLAYQSSIATFCIEFTIRGKFDPQKFKIIHHIYEGLRYHNARRDIASLEFVLYDGDIIQTHLTNGKPLCVPMSGYNSHQVFLQQITSP